jgi:hypothetical protein
LAIPIGRLAIFAALSAADLCLTWLLLTAGGGEVYESNPLADIVLAKYGWAGLVVFKLTDTLTIMWVVLVLHILRPRISRRVLSVASGIVGSVILYSLYLLYQYD